MNEFEKRQQIIDEINRRKSLEQTKIPINNEPVFSREQIKDELKRRADLQRNDETESNLKSAGRGLARGAKDLIVGGVLEPLDFFATPIRAPLNLGLKKLGYSEVSPLADTFNEYVDEKTSGFTKPKNKSEEYGSAITRGIASMPLPYVGASKFLAKSPQVVDLMNRKSKAEKVAQFVKNTNKLTPANVVGTAGAVGGGLYAADLYNKSIRKGEEPSPFALLGAQIAGGIGGGMAGVAGLHGVKGALKTAYGFKNPMESIYYASGKALKFNPEKYLAHKDAGIKPTVSNVSDSSIIAYPEDLARKFPLSHGHYQEFDNERLNTILDKLNFPGESPSTIPALYDPSLAYSGAKNFANKKSAFYGKNKKMYEDDIKSLASNYVGVDVEDILSDLYKKRSTLVGKRAIAKWNKTPEGVLFEDLKSVKADGDNGLQVPFGNFEQARNEMGKLSTAIQAGKKEKTEAQELYNRLKQRHFEFLEKNLDDPDKLKALKENQKYWADYARVIPEKGKTLANLGDKQFVTQLLTQKSDEAAGNLLFSKNPKFLNIVIKGTPKEQQDTLYKSINSRLGHQAAENKWNLNFFISNWNKQSEAWKRTYLDNLPLNHQGKEGFLKLFKLLHDNKKTMQAVMNTSGTSYTKGWMDLLGDIKTGVAVAVTKGAGVGIPVLTELYAGLLATATGARLLTNQTFLERMNKALTSTTTKQFNNRVDLLFKTPLVKKSIKQIISRSIQNNTK